ncbi:uridine kinase [Aeromicrobium flavum]|uniref:Uridine kinase n=1 Tax=Aeromicrobium flavum TaxID=416568 RepID=A0A512HUK6_9ACTN|nr:uridine kinase [Aeromicrobium flavum]GEO89139.1 uridine kinase [Aeromicrobium flavum]
MVPVATRRRREVLGAVARHLLPRRPGHPLRVGIDGVCGSGKTTFAAELAAQVEALGRPAIVVDSDGFHHVRSRRRRRLDDPARGYYEDAYDFDALRDRVLVPLGPGGTRRFAVRVHDLESDAVITDANTTAPVDAVMLFAATFLQRAGLRDLWDEVIHLHVDLEVAQARGVERDAAALGGAVAATRAYEERYLAACRLYVAEQDPAPRASIVVDNTVLEAPRLLRPSDDI